MALIADILLGAGALGAALYCLVLSRRLQRFTRLEDGMGGAIAVLSAQVDDLTRALRQARTAATTSEAALIAQTARAEQAAERLALMLASMHDLPDPPARQACPLASVSPAERPHDPPPDPVHDRARFVATPENPEGANPDGVPAGDDESTDAGTDEATRRLRFVRRRANLARQEAAE